METSADDAIGCVTEEGVQVMTLGRMYTTDDAVQLLHDRWGIPDVTTRQLGNARKRGEIPATVFGRSVLYAEQDIERWIASKYGNANERYAAQATALMGNTHAAKKA